MMSGRQIFTSAGVLLAVGLGSGVLMAFSSGAGETVAAVDIQGTMQPKNIDYERARWDPIHFKPAIANASDQQCLECHQEILDRRVLPESPAGVTPDETLAWYQTLATYEGEQETFHRRHIATSLAKRLMNMRCNTCHQGFDPREEAPLPPATENTAFTLRKAVNPQICLMCHGQFPAQLMGLPSAWEESGKLFGNNCLTCHAAIRTVRHQVNFLNPAEIESAGRDDSDICYGCHGGRAWYRISYPYPRHVWPGAPAQPPDWAKERPTKSEPRFLNETASSN
jgi:hypothetical protein